MEKFSNNGQTTLNGTITNVATSLIVTDASSFPNSGNFRIKIDSEIMLVTAVSGTTFTVTRGAESTTAAAHTSGATVTQSLTNGGLIQALSDNVIMVNNLSMPAIGRSGRIAISDTWPTVMWRDSGTAWETINPVYVPSTKQITASMFAGTFNTTGQTATYAGGMLELIVPNTGYFGYYSGINNSTSPWTVDCVVRSSRYNQYGQLGLFLQSSTTGNGWILYENAGRLNLNRFNGSGVYQATDLNVLWAFLSDMHYLRCSYSSGTCTFYHSHNGRDYYKFGTSTNISPDRFGVGGENTLSTQPLIGQAFALYQS